MKYDYEIVLEELVKEGEITNARARELGVSQLRKRIPDLKKKGYDIRRKKRGLYTYHGLEKPKSVDLNDILKLVSQMINIPAHEITSSSRKKELVDGRQLFAMVALSKEYKIAQIADYLDMDWSSVDHLINGRYLPESYYAITSQIIDSMEEKPTNYISKLALDVAIHPENKELKKKLKAFL